LSEILRGIGYPRPVSIENFRSPNFPLVADIGHWLINQYEPKTFVPEKCDTEQDRVAFIRTFAEFMVCSFWQYITNIDAPQKGNPIP